MEKGSRRPIYSSTYNFSENDVMGCKSLEKLREWYEGVAIDISIMKDKLDNPKNQKEKDGEWKRKIQSALKSQEFLLERIKQRIVQIKNDPPEFCFVEIKFVEEAKRVLDEKTFEKIRKGAEKRIIFD